MSESDEFTVWEKVVGPESAANRHGGCVGVPGVVRIFGHDPR